MEKRLSRSFQIVLLAGLCLGAVGCEDASKPEIKRSPKQTPKHIDAPPFVADSAYSFIAKQVEFGPRVPNSESHIACGDWIVRELRRHGAQVIEQPGRVRAYDGNILTI